MMQKSVKSSMYTSTSCLSSPVILNSGKEAFGAMFSSNRPYSYSHSCAGNEHEREADAGKSFQMHEPSSHARSSPTARIRIRSI